MFLIIFFFLNFTNSQRLSLLDGNITIFDDQHFLISKQFSIDNLNIKTCQSCSAFISNAAENYNEFVINNNNNNYVKFSYSVKSFDPNIVSVNHGSQNISRKILLKPNQSWQFRVPYFCNPNNIGKQWTIIQINFTINNAENQLAYYKLCNKQQKAFHPYIFLIIFSTLSVLAGSFYGKNQINPFGQTHSETLGALTILIFVILSSLILISFLKFQNIGIYFTTFIVMLIVFIATETLILDFQNNYDYSIKIKLIFSSFLSLMLIIAYFCTKNWIINNMQAISILLFSLKNIEIDCLKNGIILLFISASYETFWVFFSPNIFGTQILQTFGTQIELPVKLLCPSFNEQFASPITQCQVLGIGDILLVGIVIKYIFKFEQTDGEYKIVFLFSLLGFVVGLLFYFISAHYYSIQWYPALYCVFPSTLVSIIIVSSFKKRFYQLWLGQVQPLFNDGTEVEQI